MATQQDNVSFGPLEGLIGTWEGFRGWSLISVPALSSEDSPAKFKLMVHNYKETLTFTPIDVPVENKGGEQTQFIKALKYEQEIYEFKAITDNEQPMDSDQEPEYDTTNLIHAENGMIMLLDDIQPEIDGTTPKFTIARSSSIPHGDSALILGNSTEINKGPVIPDIRSTPSDEDQVGMPEDYLAQFDEEQKNQTIYDIVTHEDSLIFNVFNPNDNIRRDNNGLTVEKTIHIALDSNNDGGVTNVPFIVKHANATRFQADFWLQTIKLPMSGETYQQLQYSQNVDIEFHERFDGKPGVITWPHIQINTLTKQE